MMDSGLESSAFLMVATAAVGGVILIIVWKYLKGNQASEEQGGSTNAGAEKYKSDHENGSSQSSKGGQKHFPKHSKKTFTFSHELLKTSLKGHGGNVLDFNFSINGKYIATTADDRTVRLWSTKDFGTGNKSIRINVELDHAKQIHFSPDSRAFILGLARGNNVRVYRLGKKDDGTTLCSPLEHDFPDDHRQELLGIGVGASPTGGSFVMTAYKDTTIKIRDLKGEVLRDINTNLGTNNYASVSPCGRYVAASGWTPDVKVWEVKFSKTGDYKDTIRAFDLKGHKSSVWSFAFNNDSTRMFTVSKDATWRFFDTKVEYEKGQEPSLLNLQSFNLCDFDTHECFCHSALSFDGKVAAIGMMNSFLVLSTRTGEVYAEFKEVHSELLSSLAFDVSGRYIVSSGDKHVRVFHNVLGYKETINEMKEKMKNHSSSSASWERLSAQVKKLEAELKNVITKEE